MTTSATRLDISFREVCLDSLETPFLSTGLDGIPRAGAFLHCDCHGLLWERGDLVEGEAGLMCTIPWDPWG